MWKRLVWRTDNGRPCRITFANNHVKLKNRKFPKNHNKKENKIFWRYKKCYFCRQYPSQKYTSRERSAFDTYGDLTHAKISIILRDTTIRFWGRDLDDAYLVMETSNLQKTSYYYCEVGRENWSVSISMHNIRLYRPLVIVVWRLLSLLARKSTALQTIAKTFIS